MKVTFIKGEIQPVIFEFEVDITTATFTLICRDEKGELIFTKEDVDFDKSQIADKIIKVTIDTTTLDIEKYYMELKTVWSSASIDLSGQYILEIIKSLFD